MIRTSDSKISQNQIHNHRISQQTTKNKRIEKLPLIPILTFAADRHHQKTSKNQMNQMQIHKSFRKTRSKAMALMIE